MLSSGLWHHVVWQRPTDIADLSAVWSPWCLLKWQITFKCFKEWLLTCSMEQSHFEKLTGSQLVKKFPSFYGTRTFITAFTSASHPSVSWANHTSRRAILILSSHIRLGLTSGPFASCFPTKTLCTHLLSPIRATCPAHLILLDLITRTILGEGYRSLSS